LQGRGTLELRQSLVGVPSGGQRDPVDVWFCNLKKRGERNRVRELCESKREEGMQIRDQEGAEAYCKTAVISFTSGSAAAYCKMVREERELGRGPFSEPGPK
jgi:hypothetical protein